MKQLPINKNTKECFLIQFELQARFPCFIVDERLKLFKEKNIGVFVWEGITILLAIILSFYIE